MNKIALWKNNTERELLEKVESEFLYEMECLDFFHWAWQMYDMMVLVSQMIGADIQ